MIEMPLADLAATRALARALAGVLGRGDVVALSGALGAGKTELARFVILARAEAARLPPPAEVPSPTYTLVQVYEAGAVPLWHFDLYRLERPDDALELAIEEAFADAITVIEWPDRLGPYMPDDRIEIALSRTGAGDARRAAITGIGARGREIEAALSSVLAKGAA
jgi:tRNA threonylcarbamoyladenosine biosynthesis protein TsaE